MVTRLIKYLALLLLSTILGVAAIYLGMRAFGMGLIFPAERETLPIARTPERDFSKFQPVHATDGPLDNVIIFNIAGLGANQVLATRYRYYGKYGRLNMERMTTVALVNNAPLGSSLASDPHAAATAMATGHKAFNGKLSPPGSNAYPTILQHFKSSGRSVGIITNSYITGASTAAFASNVDSRSQQMEIAKQMITGRIDFMVGGGNEFYKDGFDASGAKGTDFARKNGYRIITANEQLLDTQAPLVLGLFDDLYSDRYAQDVSFDPEDPTFTELTSIAIDHLQRNEKGFFLFIDDEGTDFGGYTNRADYLTQHLMRTDEAVAAAIAYAQKDQRTLVLVLTEAEAGGMVITGGDTEKGVMSFSWGSNRHTAQMVPLFAFGPGSAAFSGVIENTDIPRIISELIARPVGSE